MFYVFKGNVVSTAQMCLTLAHNRFLLRRQYIVRIYQLLGLNDDCSFDLRDLDKIPCLQSQGIKDFFRNHDLAALFWTRRIR